MSTPWDTRAWSAATWVSASSTQRSASADTPAAAAARQAQVLMPAASEAARKRLGAKIGGRWNGIARLPSEDWTVVSRSVGEDSSSHAALGVGQREAQRPGDRPRVYR